MPTLPLLPLLPPPLLQRLCGTSGSKPLSWRPCTKRARHQSRPAGRSQVFILARRSPVHCLQSVILSWHAQDASACCAEQRPAHFSRLLWGSVLTFPPPLPDPLLQEPWQEEIVNLNPLPVFAAVPSCLRIGVCRISSGFAACIFENTETSAPCAPEQHYVQFRKQKMSRGMVMERAESDASCVPPKEPPPLACSPPPSVRSAEEASRHSPSLVQPVLEIESPRAQQQQRLGPWTNRDEIKTFEQHETVPRDVQKIVHHDEATESARQALGHSKFLKIEVIFIAFSSCS